MKQRAEQVEPPCTKTFPNVFGGIGWMVLDFLPDCSQDSCPRSIPPSSDRAQLALAPHMQASIHMPAGAGEPASTGRYLAGTDLVWRCLHFACLGQLCSSMRVRYNCMFQMTRRGWLVRSLDIQSYQEVCYICANVDFQ